MPRLTYLIYYCAVLSLVACNNRPKTDTPKPDYFLAMKITDSLQRVSNDSSSLLYIDSMYSAVPDTATRAMYEKYDLKRSFYYESRQDYITANLYADSMIGVFKGKEKSDAYIKDYGNAFLVKGDALLALKRYNEAFHYYYQAKLLTAKVGDGNYAAGYSSRMGLNCFRQGRFNEAAAYFKQAYAERLPSRPVEEKALFQQLAIEQEMLDNVALCYDRLGMPDSAVFYFNKTLAAIAAIDSTFSSPAYKLFTQEATGVVYGNMGNVYYAKGDTATAEKLWKQSITINSQKGYVNDDARITQAKLAGLYLASGRLPEAGTVLENLGRALDTVQDNTTRLKWYKLRWDYYDKTNQVANAYQYVRHYLLLKDSLDAAAKNTAATDMSGAFNVLEQQHQNELLVKANAVKKLYLFIAIIVAAAALLIALLVWQNWKRSKRNIALLTQLNGQMAEHNNQMQQTLTALQQSQEENTRMMKIVAHDLRNPVSSTVTIASILLDQPDISGENKKLFEMLKTSGENSLELISDLLMVQGRNEKISKEAVDLYVLLQYCVDLLRYKADEKQQQVVLLANHVTLQLNREKMWRVISNLIANAIKFSPHGATTTISVEEKNDAALVIVHDQGIGIPTELQSRIFDMFTTAKRRGTAGEQTFGLGLAIAKQIVEAHEGKIWFESQPGKGSSFYVSLPMIN